MKCPRMQSCGRPRGLDGSPKIRGFGLVELMVAMVLGLLVLGAAFAIFLSSQRTFLASEGINRIQESARVAFELMSRDIRAAGGSACSNASFVENTGPESLAFRDAPIAADPAGGLRVRSGDDMAFRVITSTATSVTLDTSAEEAFNEDDILLLCNARKTYVVQATGVSGATVSFAALPGGYVPTNDEFAPPTAVVLARYRDVRWFAEDNDRGGESLYVSRMDGDREEVAEGVEDLEFQYLDNTTGTYGAAPDVNTVAVRMTMTLRGQNIDGEALTRTVSNVVSLRGRTL